MGTKITIGGALANTGGKGPSTDELVNFLKSKTSGVDYYKLNPPPGTITGGAFDWLAVLGGTASILAIGQALWAAYRKFVNPLKDKETNSAFLYICIKTEHHIFRQYTIGKDITDETIFINLITKDIEDIRISLSADQDTDKEPSPSGYWKKV